MAYNSVTKEPELTVIISGVLVPGGLFVSCPQTVSWRSKFKDDGAVETVVSQRLNGAGHAMTLTEISRAASLE